MHKERSNKAINKSNQLLLIDPPFDIFKDLESKEISVPFSAITLDYIWKAWNQDIFNSKKLGPKWAMPASSPLVMEQTWLPPTPL